MPDEDRRPAADLAAELIAADRPPRPVADEPPPVASASNPLGLLLYPFLRRNRKVLLPAIVVGIVVLTLVSLLD